MPAALPMTPESLALAAARTLPAAAMLPLPGGVVVRLAVGAALAVPVAASLGAAALPSDAVWTEMCVGAVIGLSASAVFHATSAAWSVINASAFPLGTGAAGSPAFAVLAWAVVMGLDGHLLLMSALAESYRAVPPGRLDEARAAGMLASTLAVIPSVALRLAAPALVAAALADLLSVAVMRLAPLRGHPPSGRLPTPVLRPVAVLAATAAGMAGVWWALRGMIVGATGALP
jgi:flagellar biosynthetic protein FliR